MKRMMLFCLLAATTFAAEPVTQTYTEAEAWRMGWPAMHGPFGNFLPARTGVKLVDNLNDVRVVWESEDKDFGRAKCATGLSAKILTGPTEFTALGSTRHGGSWAGPIVAEGKVFSASFRPGGTEQAVAGGKMTVEADDLLIALDALSGKPAWKAIEPGGVMWGMGKRQGWQVAPVYHAGKVFFMGTTGRLFAYAAATGKKLWQTDIGATYQQMEQARQAAVTALAKGQIKLPKLQAWHTSLVVADGVLVVPLFDSHDTSLRGVDVETGQTKWELKAATCRWATPAVWRQGEKEYLLAATIGAPGGGSGKLRLIEPATGKVLWTVDKLDGTWFTLAPSATHVLVNSGSTARDKSGEKRFGLLAAYRITPEKAERAWAFPDELRYRFPNWMDCCAMRRVLARDGLLYVNLYATGTTEEEKGPGRAGVTAWFYVVREATGEIVGEYQNAGKEEPDQIGGVYYLVEDRLLCRANDSHAPSHGRRHPFTMWQLGGKEPQRLPGELDRHELATAYEVFMEKPIVAGRVWMRDERGFLVCYDLRATAEKKQ
jgi:outer membrane protein assembly factor BamB